VVALAALLAAPAVQARESRFKTGLEESGHPAQWAAGLTLGDPFGFTLKRYLGGADAIDFNIALAYGPASAWEWTGSGVSAGSTATPSSTSICTLASV